MRKYTEKQIEKLVSQYMCAKICDWPKELFWYVQGAQCGCGDAIAEAIADFCRRKDAREYLGLNK